MCFWYKKWHKTNQRLLARFQSARALLESKDNKLRCSKSRFCAAQLPSWWPKLCTGWACFSFGYFICFWRPLIVRNAVDTIHKSTLTCLTCLVSLIISGQTFKRFAQDKTYNYNIHYQVVVSSVEQKNLVNPTLWEHREKNSELDRANRLKRSRSFTQTNNYRNKKRERPVWST